MSLRRFISSELIDIVEWLDDSHSTLVHRFERHDNEIKHGAQLIVRPGQAAVFVSEGQIADVFGPGRYELVTKNLPVLSTLQGWKHGFDSPFKAEVYFVSTRQFTAQKWGTPGRIMVRDPEFGPVRLGAFGSFTVQVKEPARLVTQITGTNGAFRIEGINDQIRSFIASRFAEAVGEGGIPALDLAANYSELAQAVLRVIGPQVEAYGLELPTFVVENISLPENVEQALDKRTSMGVIGDMDRYTRYQTAESMRAAADNPGGGASEGMGLGMGMAMGHQMAQAMTPRAGGSPPGPPPLPHPGPQYFLGIDGKQAGPFSAAELQRKVGEGTLTPETLAWMEGMDAWKAAGEIPELARLFGGSPPPLPEA